MESPSIALQPLQRSRFSGMKIFAVGIQNEKQLLKAAVEMNGGVWLDSLTSAATHLVTTPEYAKKASAYTEFAVINQIPIINEQFIHHSIQAAANLDADDYMIESVVLSSDFPNTLIARGEVTELLPESDALLPLSNLDLWTRQLEPQPVDESVAHARRLLRTLPDEVLMSLFQQLKSHILDYPRHSYKTIYQKDISKFYHTFQLRERSHNRFRINIPTQFYISVDGENCGSFDSLNLEKLKQKGSIAPFGRGTETVVDLKVRNCLHIKGDRIQFNNADLADLLEKTIMGTPNLYQMFRRERILVVFDKMCIYETGGFFKGHKDTLKNSKHVASLVLSVTSNYKGGELCLQEPNLAAISRERLEAQDAALFYTDVHHEVKPVTEGTRVTLHFDVFWRYSSSFSQQELSTTKGSSILKIYKKFKKLANTEARKTPSTKKGALLPPYIGFLLKYKYHSNTNIENLKGSDLTLYTFFKGQGHRCSFQTVIVKKESEVNDDEECTVYPVNPNPNKQDKQIVAVIVPSRSDILEMENFHTIEGEDTGNEGQSFVNFYYSAALMVSSEPERISELVRLSEVGTNYADITVINHGVVSHQNTLSPERPQKKRKTKH